MIGAFARMLRVAAFALLAAPLHAAYASLVLVDNYGPVGTSRMGSWALSYSYPTAGQTFTAHTSARLESIAVTFLAGDAIHFGGRNGVDISLRRDVAGRPGEALETFQFIDAMRISNVPTAPLVATSVTHPVLRAGEQYWVVASVADYATFPGVYAGWEWNTVGDIGALAFQARGNPQWFFNSPAIMGAYRVTGVIPEASTIALQFAGLLVVLLGGAARRRSRQTRFPGSFPAA